MCQCRPQHSIRGSQHLVSGLLKLGIFLVDLKYRNHFKGSFLTLDIFFIKNEYL